MNDTVFRLTVLGFIGAILVDGLTYIYMLFGVPTSSPWEIAADVFLARPLVTTSSGILLGLFGTYILSVISAVIIVLIVRFTGTDFALLKGAAGTYIMGFATMGLFMPLLRIWPHIQLEPVTLWVALINLGILGVVQGYFIANWERANARI